MFLLEAINRIHTIKSFGAHDIWLHRFHKLELKSAKAQNRSENITSFINNFSQTLIKVAGMIGILWGAIRVMDGNMSVGGMMVIVLLIWRALSPIQSLFLALSRIDHIVSGIQQLNNLMKLPTEPEPKTNEGQIALIMSNLEHVRVEQVAFRYPTQLRPSLAGIVMEAKPGEMVVIIGDNGSGKSTLLKLLLGFYPIPQGRIAYDNIDITQYNPILLRQAIGYAPQVCQFFHGSIAQNLRMSNPEATEQQMKLACEQAGVLKDIIKLPKKFETIMTDHSAHQFSSGFLHRLALARTYVKNSSLMILDEPGNTLDFDSNELLKDNLQKYHGDKTIIIASHRPSIVKLADRVLALQNGQMFAFGPRDKVLEALQGVKR